MMTVAATSHAAKRSLTRGATAIAKKTILSFLIGRGSTGGTIEEITNETGIKLQTVCARRKELDTAGLVLDSGTRRPTSSGRSAIVWVVPKAVAAAAIKRGWKIERR